MEAPEVEPTLSVMSMLYVVLLELSFADRRGLSKWFVVAVA
jgi:hypothetical protein